MRKTGLAVTQMQDRMTDVAQRIDRLQQAPKFGNDEYAKRAAARISSARWIRMNGPSSGCSPVARAVAGVGCLAFATTGCTSTVTGTASPASGASPTASADVFAGINACQVLDQLVAGDGFDPGENKSRRNECGATKPGVSTYGLALDPVQGLREFSETNDAVESTSVNGRDALQADMPVGGCAIAIEVGEHARAMVQVSLATGPDDPRACVDARAFAERLEPLLPKVR